MGRNYILEASAAPAAFSVFAVKKGNTDMKIQRILQFISTVAVDHDVFSLLCHTLILNFTQNQKVAQTFKHWYHSISDHLSLVWFSSLLEGKLDGAI